MKRVFDKMNEDDNKKNSRFKNQEITWKNDEEAA